MRTAKIKDILIQLHDKPKDYCDMEDIGQELRIPNAWEIPYEKEQMDICYEKGFDNWTCWDTQVGKYMIYLNDEPVAIRYKEFRKSDNQYFWFSEEAANKMRTHIESLLPGYDYSQLTILDEDENIPLDAEEIGDSRSAHGYYNRSR